MNNSNNSKEVRGNTKPSPSNKVTDKRFRKCCFVLNNWTNEEYISITQEFNMAGYKYIIGKEIGEICKTPHLQGYVEFGKQVYFSTLKKLNNRIHWDSARGSRASNITYCSKQKDFICNFPEDRQTRLLGKYRETLWKDWQANIIQLVETEPDDRTITWVYEKEGNVGKSYLAKYLFLKYDAIIADGKKDNVFNQIKVWMDEKPGLDPRLIILDVPRKNLDYVSYGTLEQIKNGLIYSGKYEGGACAFENPHVIIFANELPHYEEMSKDRWNIIRIGL